MATTYDAAVEALYQGSLDTFVAERKRLANELKAGGDKEAAARLAKLGRPSISAWAVNQVFWRERDAFDDLLATAQRLRRGELDAGPAHQRALAALRALAASLLASGGHAAPESTLRRVTTTLSALAAAGGFDPDPPGALVSDRDPPGFEAFDVGAASFERAPKLDEKPRTPTPQPKPTHANVTDLQTRRSEKDLEEAKRRKEADRQREEAERERKRAAEERRLEEERARKRAERERLESALRVAQTDAEKHRFEAERLRRELGVFERKLEKAEATIADLKAALAALE